MSEKELKERIKQLKALKQAEMKGDKSELYISDLNESIAACERQLQNPSPGYVMVG